MARTRQPQGPTRIAPQWASRVLFAQIGGIPYDPISKILATVAGSPGVSASVGGRTHAYTSGVNNHSYQVPDAPFLGALSIFGIVTPASGAASTNYISKSAADNIQQPCYAGFESAYNGLYVVRSQSVSGFRSWRPTSASIAAGARATFAVIWATNRIETGPTFYVNATSSAATQVFSGGTTTGDVAGSGAPIKVGNRDSKDAGQIELIVALSGALSTADYLSLYANPYQLFAQSRRVWVQLGLSDGGGGPTTYNVSYTDSKTLTDLYSSLAVFNSAYPESKVLSDAYWGTGTLVGAYSESITLNDADTGDVGAATYSRNYDESITLSDTYTSQLVGTAAQDEAITLSETYAGSGVFVAAVSESVSLSDTQEQDSAKLGNLTETISLSDAYTSQLVAVSSYSDTIDTQDLYSSQAVFSSEITDSSTLLDAYAATIPGGAGDGTLTEETIDLIADEVMRRLYENPVRRM